MSHFDSIESDELQIMVNLFKYEKEVINNICHVFLGYKAFLLYTYHNFSILNIIIYIAINRKINNNTFC